jgi:hypothetical protein
LDRPQFVSEKRRMTGVNDGASQFEVHNEFTTTCGREL